MNEPRTLEEIKRRQANVSPSPIYKAKQSQHNCVKCGNRLVRIGFAHGCTECGATYREEGGMLTIDGGQS